MRSVSWALRAGSKSVLPSLHSGLSHPLSWQQSASQCNQDTPGDMASVHPIRAVMPQALVLSVSLLAPLSLGPGGARGSESWPLENQWNGGVAPLQCPLGRHVTRGLCAPTTHEPPACCLHCELPRVSTAPSRAYPEPHVDEGSTVCPQHRAGHREALGKPRALTESAVAAGAGPFMQKGNPDASRPLGSSVPSAA